MRTASALILAAVVALATGCNTAKDPKPKGDAPASKAPASAAAKSAASTAPKSAASAAPKSAASAAPKSAAPKSVATPKPMAKPPMYAGSHILVAYKGANRAKPTITRTKEEALKKAQALVKTARGGADFAKLAAENSDGPSAKRGGSLGAWQKGRMVPAFDTAIGGMKIGDISEPVETPFGYHVIRRNELPEMRAGAHILIAYKGAMRARPTITRTKDEALAKAKELVKTARANPAGFAELAKTNSDGPSARRGGDLGTWPKGKMVPEFDKAIDGMKVGDISEPVETPFGFHVIIRKDAK